MNKGGKILCVICIALLLFNCVLVGAASVQIKNGVSVISTVDEYPSVRANKLLSSTGNIDASVLICFNDGLYMGTLNLDEGCELWRTFDGKTWEQVVGGSARTPNGFGKKSNCAIWSGKVFGEQNNRHLYVGTMNWMEGCEVWRSPDGINWTAVVGGSSVVPAGFGGLIGQSNYYAWIMEIAPLPSDVYPSKNVVPHLCIGTFNLYDGGQIWKSVDGERWTTYVGDSGETPNGFGDPDNYGIRTMKFYGGKLYVGTATKLWKTFKGCEIWRNYGLYMNHTNWEKITDDGFGDLGNKYAWSMVEFNECLYVGTINMLGGCEIWRTSNGVDWTRVVDRGFQNKNNEGARIMTVFNEAIYVGTCNFISGCEVWRSRDGVNWTQINRDGFGDARNWAVRQLTVFNESLYAGTWNFNGYEIWRYDGKSWTEIFVENSHNDRVNPLALFGVTSGMLRSRSLVVQMLRLVFPFFPL